MEEDTCWAFRSKVNKQTKTLENAKLVFNLNMKKAYYGIIIWIRTIESSHHSLKPILFIHEREQRIQELKQSAFITIFVIFYLLTQVTRIRENKHITTDILSVNVPVWGCRYKTMCFVWQEDNIKVTNGIEWFGVDYEICWVFAVLMLQSSWMHCVLAKTRDLWSLPIFLFEHYNGIKRPMYIDHSSVWARLCGFKGSVQRMVILNHSCQ